MKKLILYSLLLISFASFAQSLGTYSLPSATGTNTYVYNPTTPLTLTNGATLRLHFTNSNSGASTLNISGTGAKSLRTDDGTALVSGQITAGADKWVIYNIAADQWRLMGGSGSGTALIFSSPLSETGGTVSIQNAAADGTTKGAATFTANDFNTSSGLVSIDYTNTTKATTSQNGVLTNTDWNTFNNKQAALVSGTTIKTVGGTTLLGSGDVPFPTSLPPNGSAGGDLTGTYPNPTIKSSVGLTGVPTAPTASAGTSTNQIATVQFVTNAAIGQRYYLSWYGATSDADLSAGSTTYGIDDAAVIQTVLNFASASNPIVVVVDGKYSSTTQLVIKSNTTIEINYPNGIILAGSANKTLFLNQNPTTSATHTDHDIYLIGKGGTLNGNGANQSVKFTTAEGWLVPFRLVGVDRFGIDGVEVITPTNFHLWIMNCNYGYVRNTRLDAVPTLNRVSSTNFDGVHMNGPLNYIAVENNRVSSGDDAFPLLANDGFQNTTPAGVFRSDDYDPWATTGQITNVIFRNNTMLPSRDGTAAEFGYRAISTTSAIIDCTFDGLYGTTTGYAFKADNYPSTISFPTVGDGDFRNLVVKNINVAVTTSSDQGLIILGGKHSNTTIDGVVRSTATLAIPMVYFDKGFNTIDNFYFRNYTQNGGASGVPIISAAGFIDNITLSNIRISGFRTPLSTPLVAFQTNSGLWNNLILENVYADNVNNIVDLSNGQINYVQGKGVTHSNPSSGEGAFKIASGKTIIDFSLNEFVGANAISGSGTVQSKRGDGFYYSPVAQNVLYNSSTFTVSNGTLLTAYTPDIGAAWTMGNSSTWVVQSSKLQPNTTTPAGSNWYTTFNSTITNAVFQYDVFVTTQQTANILETFVRMSGANKTDGVVVALNTTTGSCSFTNYVSGTGTTFGSFTTGWANDTRTHRMRITVNGTALSFYQDEVLIGSGTIPTTQTGTYFGIGTNGTSSAASRFRFDNFKVSAFANTAVSYTLTGNNNGDQTTTGTTNRITVATGSTNPVVDISSSYVGQSSITTTGPLSSGSLTTGFTTVPVTIGGTGITSLPSANNILGVNAGGTTYEGKSLTVSYADNGTGGPNVLHSANNIDIGIPLATSLIRGLMDIGNQTFKGVKTFTDAITINSTQTTGNQLSITATFTATANNARITDLLGTVNLRNSGGANDVFWASRNILAMNSQNSNQFMYGHRMDNSFTGTAVNGRSLSIGSGITKSSGTFDVIGIELNPVLNSTSTATGTHTALKYTATRTSLTGLSEYVLVSDGGKFGFGTLTPTDVVDVSGNVSLITPGNKLKIATGSNASVGTSTLSSGTVTVSTTAVTASSLIFVVYNTPSGTLASGLSAPVGSIVAGTSFVINSLTTAGVVNTLDNSTVRWWIIN